MKRNAWIGIIALLLASQVVWSQPMRMGNGEDHPGMREAAKAIRELMRNFYEPRLIIRHQQAIGLTDKQRDAITKEMQSAASQFIELRTKLASEGEVLLALTKNPRPDEKAILAQLDKIFVSENEMKKSRMVALIRVKNILTPEQQAKLDKLRPQGGPGAKRMSGPAEKDALASQSEDEETAH